MIKGVQKKVIMMQIGKNDMFESAYFILRDDREKKGEKNDMVKEANRIINESISPCEKRQKHSGRLSAFAFGAMIGILVSSSVALAIFKLLG